MKANQHLIIGIIFLTILAFELIAFYSIIGHPYMIALNLILGVIGGYQLGMATIKFMLKK